MSNDLRYTTSTAPGFVVSVSAGSAPVMPEWMRENLMNEYRALMQRAQYLRKILGIASAQD